MVKMFFTILLLVTAPLHADDIPDPLTWWNSLPESSWQEQPTLIRHLTIRSTPNRAKRWDRLMQDFSSLGFLQYVPTEDADFMHRLNPGAELADLPQELLLDPELLQMVLTDRGSKMGITVNSRKDFKSMSTWAITGQDRRNAASILAWLSRNLGYDAVVLDARDGLILAGLLKNSSELGQGLLVKQSARRWVIKETHSRGEALLQMLKTNGSLAVFEVLLAKGTTLNVEKGSKILLGQNNNWMKIMQQPEREVPQPKAAPAAPDSKSTP
ncbi:hypothetical protein [Oligoflexus tunisiensis]|uniref:hypothetical protein n=1 Tax=Oligoflexus tunisiensis TaxID=708132 RepID=UPI000A6D770D|nr:hypothetical protein [Oligoflexus tunisiensis]